MAKSKSRAYAGVGAITGSSKEVNPTFSLKKAPVAKPVTKSNVQLNPTFSAGKGNTPSKSGSTKIAAKTRVNPTFAVAQSNTETSKGSTSKKLVMAKNKVGNPIASKSNPTPLKATWKSKNNAVGSKLFAIPKRNIKGSVGAGKAKDAKADKTHNFSSPKDFSIPTNNTSAPYGPNGMEKAPMTVKRLKKLGF